MSSVYFENELDIEFRGVPHTVKGVPHTYKGETQQEIKINLVGTFRMTNM